MGPTERKVCEQLAATARLNDTFHAVISVLPDAEEQAAAVDRALEEGAPAGSLTGVTVGLKDVIATAGHPTTYGSAVHRDNRPANDATVVTRIRDHGGVVLAKTNLSEYAMGATSQNPHYGDVANAWDPSRTPGGSSGGSAVAVALGLCDIALGTDTGGSVIIPAALNGLSGFRPSIGRVSNHGVFPLSTIFDTIGPIARDVRGVRALLIAIEGHDRLDLDQVGHIGPSTTDSGVDLASLRIGVPRGHFVPQEPEIGELFVQAVEALADQGARVVEAHLPGAEDAYANMARQMFADFYELHAEQFEAHPEYYGEGLTYRLRLGQETTGAQYSRGRQWTHRWRHLLQGVFEEVDVVVTPTTSISAPAIGDASLAVTTPLLTTFTHPWCLSPGPTLSVPIGFGRHSPVGMMISGPAHADPLVLSVGAQYQELTEWHTRHPVEHSPWTVGQQ